MIEVIFLGSVASGIAISHYSYLLGKTKVRQQMLDFVIKLQKEKDPEMRETKNDAVRLFLSAYVAGAVDLYSSTFHTKEQTASVSEEFLQDLRAHESKLIYTKNAESKNQKI